MKIRKDITIPVCSSDSSVSWDTNKKFASTPRELAEFLWTNVSIDYVQETFAHLINFSTNSDLAAEIIDLAKQLKDEFVGKKVTIIIGDKSYTATLKENN